MYVLHHEPPLLLIGCSRERTRPGYFEKTIQVPFLHQLLVPGIIRIIGRAVLYAVVAQTAAGMGEDTSVHLATVGTLHPLEGGGCPGLQQARPGYVAEPPGPLSPHPCHRRKTHTKSERATAGLAPCQRLLRRRRPPQLGENRCPRRQTKSTPPYLQPSVNSPAASFDRGPCTAQESTCCRPRRWRVASGRTSMACASCIYTCAGKVGRQGKRRRIKREARRGTQHQQFR